MGQGWVGPPHGDEQNLCRQNQLFPNYHQYQHFQVGASLIDAHAGALGMLASPSGQKEVTTLKVTKLF